MKWEGKIIDDMKDMLCYELEQLSIILRIMKSRGQLYATTLIIARLSQL